MTETTTTRTDVLIVGAGPIGLELAAALKTLGVPYVHVDAGQIGQTISWFPQQARFFSSPQRIAICGVPLQTAGQDKATREEYLAYLRAVVEQFDLRVNTYERVVSVERRDGRLLVGTQHASGPRRYDASRLVLAVGDMHRPRTLNIPGEDLPHVSHYFTEPHRYFRKRLLIVGGRNSAVEAAIRCHRAGAEVAISYRQAEFDAKSVKYWLLPEVNSLIKYKKVPFHPNTVPTQITPTHVSLQSVSQASAPPTNVEADFVLLLTGYVMDPTLFQLAGVELEGENQAPRFDPATMETNVPGVYVAGTAAAGTQNRFRLFIENSHVHVTRIVRAITNSEPCIPINPVGQEFALPES